MTIGLPGRRGVHWREAHWCALDLELTGLDPRADEIVSFGAIPIEHGRVQLRSAVHQLVRPAQTISEDAILVHGIRAADLIDAPPLDAALDALVGAIDGRVLVAHTASVEREFLGRALRKRAINLRRRRIVDTELLGRLWLLERDGRLLPRLSLGRLATELGLPADRPHDALGDALTTAQVFIALCSHLDAQRRETVASLARARARVEAMRLFVVGSGARC